MFPFFLWFVTSNNYNFFYFFWIWLYNEFRSWWFLLKVINLNAAIYWKCSISVNVKKNTHWTNQIYLYGIEHKINKSLIAERVQVMFSSICLLWRHSQVQGHDTPLGVKGFMIFYFHLSFETKTYFFAKNAKFFRFSFRLRRKPSKPINRVIWEHTVLCLKF